MNMEGPSYPVFESADNKLKNEINTKLSQLLEKGTLLADIVELLDAQEFLENIEVGKKQSPVAHFDVAGFIKKRTSENRKFSLPEEYIKIDEVIIPPSEMEFKSGNGAGLKETGMIPRSTMLMETLTEMGLKYSVVEGKNDPKMMRKLSYLIFTIPSIQKLVLVNDEEGNVTFVVNKASGDEWKDYIKMTKRELYSIAHDLASTVRYPNKNEEGHQERWKEMIKNLLITKSSQQENLTNKISIISSEVPEEWKAPYQLVKILGVNLDTITKYAERYKIKHPEWVRIYKNKFSPKGFSEFYSPELIDVIKHDYERTEAPKEWMHAKELSRTFNVDVSTIKNIAKPFLESNSNLANIFSNKSKQRFLYYSPELVSAIKENLAARINHPEGWQTVYQLAESSNIDPRFIINIANDYKKTNADWLKTYKTERGQMREYINPILIEIIKNRAEEIKLMPGAPEGWITPTKLAALFNLNSGSIYSIARRYEESNPNWFKKYNTPKNETAIFYSPELVDIVKKELADRESVPIAPAGWLTLNVLSKKIGISAQTVNIYLEKYKKNHLEWIKIYRNHRNQRSEHFHPDLVDLVSKDVNKIEQAPKGWLTSNALAREINSTLHIVQKDVDPYRVNHSEWFKIYRGNDCGNKGIHCEYFSPELVNLIREKQEKIETAPDGWMNTYSLATLIGVDSAMIKRNANKYRTGHSAWFKIFKGKSGLFEYFSPELVEILQKEIPPKKKINRHRKEF